MSTSIKSKIKLKLLTLSAIIGLSLIATLILLMVPSCSNSPIDRGPVFTAVENTLAKGGPVKEDLIKRGLVTLPANTSSTPGVIKIGEIENLVKSGVYAIDNESYLIWGTAYTPPPQ
jgi:hypothetical protein